MGLQQIDTVFVVATGLRPVRVRVVFQIGKTAHRAVATALVSYPGRTSFAA